MGVGANPVLGFHLTVGGTSQFGWVRINQNLTVVGNYWVDTNGTIFQRVDASNSLNVVSTGQINFRYSRIGQQTQQQALLLYNWMTLTVLQ